MTIGIDLGTANPAVAALGGGDPVIIAGPEGTRATPPVVADLDGGEILVDQPAQRRAVPDARTTCAPSDISSDGGSATGARRSTE